MRKELARRANRILLRLQETAPRDTGDLANSLRVEEAIAGTRIRYRIVSDDPNLREIMKGTYGSYKAVPPWGLDSPLGGWASRHGFTTNRSRYALARSVAVHGTNPAGTFQNRQNWVRVALLEATR